MADIVPFPRGALPQPEPRNVVRGHRVPLDEIGADDALLGEILRYWRSLRGPAKTPVPHRSFDILQVSAVMGWAHIVDCNEADPANFFFRLYGSLCEGLFKKDLSKRRLGDIPCPIYARELMADYNTVKLSGCPAFHKIRARLDWRSTSYTRLVLPLATQGQNAKLFVAVNRRPLPELGPLPW